MDLSVSSDSFGDSDNSTIDSCFSENFGEVQKYEFEWEARNIGLISGKEPVIEFSDNISIDSEYSSDVDYSSCESAISTSSGESSETSDWLLSKKRKTPSEVPEPAVYLIGEGSVQDEVIFLQNRDLATCYEAIALTAINNYFKQFNQNY